MSNDQTAEQNIANDYKVVSFRNSETFDFTPEMGCMYDGRSINGSSGRPGLMAGESKMLPYHVGMRLATNLAKQVLLRRAGSKPEVDALGNPMPTKSIWDDAALESLKLSFIEHLYSEDRPVKQTETDLLFARIEALEGMLRDKPKEVATEAVVSPEPVVETVEELNVLPVTPVVPENTVLEFKDKQEVLAELEKRGIPHDKRASKEKLEALLK